MISVFSLIYMLIINENEDIEKDLIKLQTSQRICNNLCFVCLNFFTSTFFFNIANDKRK